MKIAVIGSGNVGTTLGRGWAAAGHEVIFGSRNPGSEKVRSLVTSIGHGVRAAGVAEAAAEAEVVVLATPWPAAQDSIKAAGNLRGKVLVDCTNAIAPGMSGLMLGLTTSAGEQVAEWAAGARVVKSFHTTGSGNMANPKYGDQPITMFLCGDDPQARSTVARLAEDLGFEPCDAGPLTAARYLEPLAMLWVHLAYVQGMGPNIALRLLKRP